MLEEWFKESEENEYFLSAIFLCVCVCVCIIEWKQFYIGMLSNISPL